MHERKPRLEKLVQSVCPPAQGGEAFATNGPLTSTTFSGAVGSSKYPVGEALVLDPSTASLADPRDLADPVAFALRSEGRRRVHNSDKSKVAIAAERFI